MVYAAFCENNYDPSTGEIIKFNRRVQFNIGNAYDSNTGKFTVPISGLYTIFLVTDPKIGVTQVLQLMVNNDGMFESWAENSSTSSSGMTLPLNKGDKVWVCFYKGTGVEAASMFSIALVRPEIN